MTELGGKNCNKVKLYSADLNHTDEMNKACIFKHVFLNLCYDKTKSEELLRVSSEIIWRNFFSEIPSQNFGPKTGNFGFFQLIKFNAETTMLIDEKYISQEASYIAQQSS